MTVDSNVFFQYFPPYLLFRLHKYEILMVWCSNLIWEEILKSLLDQIKGITPARIEVIEELIDYFLGGWVNFSTKEHSEAISKVSLQYPDDRHVLYSAPITNSRFLVTENLGDFPQIYIDYNRRNGLEFHPDFKVVSFDSF